MDKVLTICGPTATGKTNFALEIAERFNAELISADSRQVYIGKNLIYGKDLPIGVQPQISSLKWKDRYLKYYEIVGVKIWLYDVVEPGEEFSVALWQECTHLVIEDILSRQKLPIIVGGTGLFIKAITSNLTDIDVPRNESLRKELENKDIEYLWAYLQRLRPKKMNDSDRKNPRRLIRAIEIAASGSRALNSNRTKRYDFLQIGLTAPKDKLLENVDQRVDDRIHAGAVKEDSTLATDADKWKTLEHQIVRQQLTWFAKQPKVEWFDVSQDNWKSEAIKLTQKWYNK